MFIAMKSVAVDIFFITVMKQSCCDYQDRSQYIFEKYDDVEGMGAKSSSSLPSRKKSRSEF